MKENEHPTAANLFVLTGAGAARSQSVRLFGRAMQICAKLKKKCVKAGALGQAKFEATYVLLASLVGQAELRIILTLT